jgi:hypothetical protein
MKPNVGGLDKVVRIVAGLVLLSLVFVGPRTPWGWLGVLPLITGFVNFCPLYTALRWNTRKSG